MNIVGLPTAEQLKTCFVLGASITSMYQTINLIRIDERTKEIYFLAGKEIELVILENGDWSFYNGYPRF
ncbi:hypothetical protein NIES267_57620 [Calothrix parasitica NIES-267]|uniref:DUF6888 domain-containing protein n=1 Tax=Calothrix parasitica NIES-267 TaxID=1973488 RepID=A0A1Z4LYD5_9CYAN|nr:hypothetical protein NIES267_57620 [Calothrix parasitica NIES-267]